MYQVFNGEARMFIAAQDLPRVVHALRAVPGSAGELAAETDDVGSIFSCFGLDLAQDREGNVVGIFVVAEYPDDMPGAALCAIAPLVADGSYLMLVSEDAEQWGWSFRKNPATGKVEAHEETVVPIFASEYRRLTGKGAP